MASWKKIALASEIAQSVSTQSLDVSGSVGIGTTSPRKILHSYSSSGVNIVGLFESSDSQALIAFRDNTTGDDNHVMIGANGTSFAISTDNTERMVIDSSGNTTVNSGSAIQFGDSSYKIIGSTVGNYLRFYTESTQALEIDDSQNATFAGDIFGPSGLTINWLNSNTRITGSNSSGFLQFDVGGTGEVLKLTSSSSTFGGNAIFSNNKSINFLNTSGVEKAIISFNNSNVTKIGDSSNSGTLQLSGGSATFGGSVTIASGGSTDNLYLANTSYGMRITNSTGVIDFISNGSTRMSIANGGGVTFTGNTTSNGNILAQGSAAPSISVLDTTNNASLQMRALDTEVRFGSTSNHPVKIGTNNSYDSLILGTDKSATFGGKVTISKNESDEYDNVSYANSLLKLTNTNTTASQTHSLITFRLEKNGGDGYVGFKSGSSINQEHFVVGNQVDGEILEIASGGNATFVGDVQTGGTVNIIGVSSATATLNINANNGASVNNKVRFLKEIGAEFKLQMNTGGVSSFANLVNFTGTGTTFNNPITSNGLLSNTSSTYDIGSSSNLWRDAYLKNGGRVYFGDTGTYVYGSSSLDVLTFAVGTNERLKLDVNSRISLSNNDSGTGNTIFGKSASPSQAGSNNTIMGENSALAMDGGEAHNIVIGSSAMRGADEGASGTIDFNVVIGNSALWGASFTGSEQLYGNIAIGYQSLNKDGDTNSSTGQVAIGHQALKSMTSGSGNMGIGYLAGTSLTSGGKNTAIGYQAGLESTIEDFNTYIGYQSGYRTAGLDNQHNTFIGYGSGSGDWTSTKSDKNTGVGSLTLAGAMNSGIQNTALGFAALNIVTTGDSNVGVGVTAGNTLTSGSNNTIIGTDADTSASGSTNQIVIGATATGVADNSVTLGNSSITDVYMSQDSGANIHCADIYANGDVIVSKSTAGGKSNLHVKAIKSLDSTAYLLGGIESSFSSSAWLSANTTLLGPALTGYGTGVAYLTFSTDGTNKLSTFAGNLGINTDSGGWGLNVKGVDANVFKVQASDSNTLTYLQGTNGDATQRWFADGNSTKVLINTNGSSYFTGGNVGIGTASPDYKLKVEESTNGADCSIAIRALNDGGAGRTALLRVDPDAQTFTLGVPNVVTDISNERIGIGTTSPSTMLHLKSSAGSKPKITIEDTNEDDNMGALQFIKDSASPNTGDKLMQIWAYGDNDFAEQILYSEIATLPTSVADGSEEGSMRFRVMNAGSFGETMRIRGDKVGIGTTSPAVQFHVKSSTANNFRIERSGTTNAAIHFKNASEDWYAGITSAENFSISRNADIAAGTDFVIRGNTGRVGIGTSNPDTNLHIYKASAGSVTTNTNSQFTIENNSHASMQFLSPNNANSIIYFGDVDDNDVGYINYAHGSNTMNFQTNTAIRMSINGSGITNITPSSNTGVSWDNASNNIEQYFRANSVESVAKIKVSESAGGGVIGLWSKNTSGTQVERLNIDTSGNATFSGNIEGVYIETFSHNFTDDLGTSNIYIPWQGTGENTSMDVSTTAFLTPFAMELVSFRIRPETISNSGTINVQFYKQANGSTTRTDIGMANTGTLSTNNVSILLANSFDILPTVSANEKVGFKFLASTDLGGEIDWYVTTVWKVTKLI